MNEERGGVVCCMVNESRVVDFDVEVHRGAYV